MNSYKCCSLPASFPGLLKKETRTAKTVMWGRDVFRVETRCGFCHEFLEFGPWENLPGCALPPCALVDLPVYREKKVVKEPPRSFPCSSWSIKAGDLKLGFKMRSSAPEAKALHRRGEEWNGGYVPLKQGGSLYEIKPEDVEYQTPKPRFAYFAGIRVPRIGNNFWQYKRLPGEKEASWRRRIFSILKAQRLGRAERREDYWNNLVAESPTEWITRTSKHLSYANPFWYQHENGTVLFNQHNLDLDWFDEFGNVLDQDLVITYKDYPFRFKHPDDIHPRQPHSARGVIQKYQSERLAYKLRMYALQQEWREARFLRREKMSRVLLREDNHQVCSLRAKLISNIEKYVRANPDLCKNLDEESPPKGEMDSDKDAHGSDLEPKVEQKSNVAMLDQEEASTSMPVPSDTPNNEFRCLAVPKSEISSKTLDDRWFTMKKGMWGAEATNDILFEMELPKDCLNMANFKNSPNYAPFSIHSYWRGTMKIEIRLNSNPRQFGQLQARFYYMAYADANWNLRKNVAIGSQQPHILISANASNNGCLTIPFEYNCPILTITRGEQTWDTPPDVADYANIGTLICQVLVPLTVAETTARKCGYSVVIAFEASEFGGMIDKSLIEFTRAEGQMFSMASLLAINEVNEFFDNNRDNPTVSAASLPVVPVNAGSWCIGNGLPEWSNILRLNPNSSTPYPPGRAPAIDEMKIDFIKSVYGLFKQIRWTGQQDAGTLLYKFDAAPLLSKTEYFSVQSQNVNLPVLPPIAVLSELFSWWRGGMKLRVDVVGATELSGRILIAYVPKYYRNITFDQATNCAHSVFDIQKDNKQFNYLVPYVSDKLFWERSKILRDEFTTVPPPGTVYMFVHTQLIVNSTIPDNCMLNLYIAGDSDFEVSVPAFPSIGTGFFPEIVIAEGSAHEVYPKLGYRPVYVSTWHKTKWIPIFRYGNITEHVTQFQIEGNLKDVARKILKIQTLISGGDYNVTYTVQMPDGNERQFSYRTIIKNFFIFFIQGAPSFIYGIPVLQDTNGNDIPGLVSSFKDWFVKTAIIADNGMVKIKDLDNLGVSWGAIHENYILNLHPEGTKWIGFNEVIQSETWVQPDNFIAIPRADNIFAEIGDERRLAKTKPSNSQPSACGRKAAASMVFGERFFDLKDYCRRYQLYAQGDRELNNVVGTLHNIIIKFPALPQGLDLPIRDRDGRTMHYWNRSRDGPIPLMLSGFRFFSGGLRFRIIVDVIGDKDALSKGKIFVQHRPDFWNQSLTVDIRSDSLIGTDDIELPGYATYYQFDEINNIISVEIPFYLPVVKSLLQRPNNAYQAVRWSSLGEIAVGISMSSANARNLRYEIYYSFADDARASVFMGFPPMLDASNIPPFPVKPKTKAILPLEEVDEDCEFEVVRANMGFFDWSPFKKTNEALDNVSKIDVDKINSTLEDTQSFVSSLKEHVQNFVPTVDGIKNRIDKYMTTIVNVITNLVHCLLNFNIKSVCTAIVSIFTQLRLVTMDMTTKLINGLFELFKKENPGAPDELKEVAEGFVKGQMLDSAPVDIRSLEAEAGNCKAAYISTLVAGVAAALAIGPKLFKSDYLSLFTILFDGLNKFALTANHLFTFIKNNLLCIQKIGNWLVNAQPTMKDIQFLQKESEEIYEWALEVIDMTDPWKENILFTSVKKASRVHELALKGSVMMLKLSKIKIDAHQSQLMQRLQNDITKLRDRLARCHMAPPVRFEPFVYELTGKTGTAKSTLLNDLPYKMLEHLKIKVPGEVIFHRALGNAYWNNCRNQPVCSIDEKFPVTKPGFDDVQMAELFQLKSRCVFNPPMADIPDKNLRYNPLIVQYASNECFPTLTGILQPEALFRRRDCVIKVEFRQDIIDRFAPHRPTFDKLTHAERYNYSGLQFSFLRDVIDWENKVWIGPMNYNEFLKEFLKRWKEYFQAEEKLFSEQLKKVLSLSPDEEDDYNTFEQKWREQTSYYDKDKKLNQFKDEYFEILKCNKLNEGNSVTSERHFFSRFRYALANAFNRFFGKPVFSIEEFSRVAQNWPAFEESRHISTVEYQVTKGFAEQAPEVIDQIIKDTRSKVAGVGDAMPIEKTLPKSYLNELHVLTAAAPKVVVPNDIRANMAGISEDDVKHLCPHQLLTNYKIFTENTFKYDRSTGLFSVDAEAVEYEMNRIDMDFEKQWMVKEFAPILELEKPPTDAQPDKILKFKSDYYFSYMPCSNMSCPFSEEANRIDFFISHVKCKAILTNCLINGKIESVMSQLSEEYVRALYKKNSPSDENAKRIEEDKKEVGFVRGLYEKLKEQLMNVNWKKWFKRLLCIMGVIFFIGSIWGIWAFVTTGAATSGQAAAGMGVVGTALTSTTKAEAFASGDHKIGHTKKDTPRLLASKTLLSLPKGEMNYQQLQALRGNLERNTFFLSMFNKDGKPVVGRCVGICGKYALIPDHFYEAWNTFRMRHMTTTMHYIPCSSKIPTAINIDFNELKYRRFTQSGLGILEMPVRIPNFKDIRKWIAPKAFHANSNGIGTVFEATHNAKQETIHREIKVDYFLQAPLIVRGGELFSDFETGSLYKYRNFKGEGCCGSVLVNDFMNMPITGMHLAGSDTYGYAECVYQEMFMDLDVNKTISPEAQIGIGQSTKFYVDAEVIGWGAVAARFAHRANEKSRIIPSEIQKSKDQNFKQYTEVAILSKNDPRQPDPPFSPMIEGCKHHGKPLLPFCEADFKIAKEDLKNLILSNCKPQRLNPRLLTEDQAIGGIPEKPGYEHIEWKSSEGFPFVASRPKGAKDKSWLFNFDSGNQYTSIKEQCLRETLDKKWEMRKHGIIPDTVFTDCLKDCTIDKEKVRTPGKTRIFSISPVDFTIQQRQCTLDFVVAFMANRLNLEHAVGINPDSLEWTDLATHLLNVGSDIVTGDYSKFGDTIPPEFIHAFFEIVIEWYLLYGELSEDHKQQLKIMAHEISHSIHLMFDFVYKVICGQPSGNSLTVIINSFSNSLYIRLAWLKIMRGTKFNSLEYLHKHIRFFSYGDDIIMALSKDIKELFNATHLFKFFGDHNLKFTNADKSDQIIKYTNLNEADFLKRGFVAHPTRQYPLQVILAPLGDASVEDTVNWVNRDSFGRDNPQCQNYIDMCVQVCEDALRNAFGKGPEYYNKFALKLINFWRERNIHFKFSTWEQLDHRVFALEEPINDFFKIKYIRPQS